jgi:thymidine kinase
MSIEVITGPMFAGKTTELLQRAQRYRYIGSSMLIIKPAIDSRYGADVMMTHSGIKEHDIVTATLLKDIEEHVSKYEVLLIDEGQFFDDLVKCVVHWRNDLRKIVIVACLDMTSDLTPFRDMGNLFAMADKITKLKSVCLSCKKDASFSKCLVNKSSDSDILIGGAGTYVANCLDCYFKK